MLGKTELNLRLVFNILGLLLCIESLFMLATVGDMLGVPVLPPYYSLHLLPYVVPQISTWKRRLLREKDVSDAMF